MNTNKTVKIQDLDHYDRSILLALDKNARHPLSKIAKTVGLGSDLVDYRVKKLSRYGLLAKCSPIVNPHALGVTIFKTYIRHRFDQRTRAEFIATVQQHPRKYWFAEGYGAWDMIISLAAENTYQFQEDQDQLFSRYSENIIDSSVYTLVDVVRFPKFYLKGSGSDRFPEWGRQQSRQELGELEKDILLTLSEDCRVSKTELAKKLGTTSAIIDNRISKLEKTRVILAYRTQLDYRLLGMVVFKVFVSLRAASPTLRANILEYCQNEPHITCFVQQVGNIQIEVEAEVRDHGELNDILCRFRNTFNQHISKLEYMMIHNDYYHRIPI